MTARTCSLCAAPAPVSPVLSPNPQDQEVTYSRIQPYQAAQEGESRVGWFYLGTVAFVALLLAVTNPSKQDFADWATEKATEWATQRISTTNPAVREPLVRTVAASVTKAGLEASTSTANYVLFSVFTTEGPKGETQSRAVGFLRQFVFLKSPDLEGTYKQVSAQFNTASEVPKAAPDPSWGRQSSQLETSPAIEAQPAAAEVQDQQVPTQEATGEQATTALPPNHREAAMNCLTTLDKLESAYQSIGGQSKADKFVALTIRAEGIIDGVLQSEGIPLLAAPEWMQDAQGAFAAYKVAGQSWEMVFLSHQASIGTHTTANTESLKATADRSHDEALLYRQKLARLLGL